MSALVTLINPELSLPAGLIRFTGLETDLLPTEEVTDRPQRPIR